MSETESFGVLDKQFWILERSGKTPETSVHQAIDTAIIRVRALLSLNVDPKELVLTRITVGDEAFVAQPVDWSEIAKSLINVAEQLASTEE